jgi:hypothetical protein
MDRFDLLTIEAAQFLTIFTFLFIVLVTFLKYLLFQSSPGNRDVQKIIGGLSVFIVAILSQSWQVMAISLLIGGLIIASEEFMEKLAIILRSESKDIGTNLSVTKAEPKEIKDKLKEEVGGETQVLRKANLANTHVKSYLSATFGPLFKSEVKITTEDQELIVDGILDNVDGSLKSVVEIRYEPKPTQREIQDIILTIKHQVQKTLPGQHVTLCMVVNENPSSYPETPEDISLMMFKLKRGGVELLYTS